MLDKQIGVLGLKQIVAFDLALEILTELLVSENQLLDGGVLLPKVDVTLLIAVDNTLELGNLDPQFCVISSLGIRCQKLVISLA